MNDEEFLRLTTLYLEDAIDDSTDLDTAESRACKLT